VVRKKETSIMTAAYGLFLQHGYKKVTMTEIAEAACMSRPALYAAFPNRLAIFDRIIREVAANNAALGADILKTDQTAAGRLKKIYHVWIMGHFEGCDHNHFERLSALTLQSNIVTPDAARFYWDTFERQIVEAVSLWTPINPALDSDLMASILLAATRDFKLRASSFEMLKRQIEGLLQATLSILNPH
jgi:AcrR family transcriptional regulator